MLMLAELVFQGNLLVGFSCPEGRCIILETQFFEILSKLDGKPEISCSVPSALAMWCADRAACIVADPVHSSSLFCVNEILQTRHHAAIHGALSAGCLM